MGSQERGLKTGNALGFKPFFMYEMEREGDKFYVSCKVTMSSSGFLQMMERTFLVISPLRIKGRGLAFTEL